jgi:predicted small lipoprotein YifL
MTQHILALSCLFLGLTTLTGCGADGPPKPPTHETSASASAQVDPVIPAVAFQA